MRIVTVELQGDQNVSVHLTITVQKTRKNTVFKTVSTTYHDNVVRIRFTDGDSVSLVSPWPRRLAVKQSGCDEKLSVFEQSPHKI
jgi:hypothetical protein